MTMKEINYRKIEEMPITIEVMNMISALHEYKGRQELYIETQPEILERLMEVARIQVRRLDLVLADCCSISVCLPSRVMVVMVRMTEIVPRSKSMASHFSPSASLRRRP